MAMERSRWQLFRKRLSRRNNGDFVSDNISDRQADVNRKLEQAYDDLIKKISSQTGRSVLERIRLILPFTC